MGRTKEQQREYMASYRARKKAASYDLTAVPGRIDLAMDFATAQARINDLEEEVRHLKEELAKRPSPLPSGELRSVQAEPVVHHGFNTRPFTPAPKRRV